MVIHINQSRANFAIEFKILVDDVPTYTGVSSPISSAFSNRLMDKNGYIIYQTQLQPLVNLKGAVPFKWVWSKQISRVCDILDDSGKVVATFSYVRESLLNDYYSIWGKGFDLRLYDISKGAKKYILLFVNDKQIGQIHRNNFVENNRSEYVFYLLSQHEDFAPLVSLFTIYYDSYNHSNRGQIVAYKTEFTWEWTLGKYNKLYNPKWLQTHFGKANPFF